MKQMAVFEAQQGSFSGKKLGLASNVKESQKYERFGESIRYMTIDEWQRFLDCIDEYEHKLMMRTIYELGCRVGEFVRIRLRDIDFSRARFSFPKENTKTGRRRISFVSGGLINDLRSWLKENGRMGIRRANPKKPDEFLFSPARYCQTHFSENRLRQIFRRYILKAGLDRRYGRDSRGRELHELTVHSLRHTHIMHFIHVHKLPIAVVQKQVGHTSLKTTSVYLNPSEEAIAEAYRHVQVKVVPYHHNA